MNPCHLLIRVFGWGTMANLPSSPILYFFLFRKWFSFFFCAFGFVHIPGVGPLVPVTGHILIVTTDWALRLPHLTCPLYNLSICFPTIHMFPIFHFIFFFFFSLFFYHLLRLPHLTCPLYKLSICFPTTHMFPIFHFIFFFFFFLFILPLITFSLYHFFVFFSYIFHHWLGLCLSCPLYNFSICFPTIHIFLFYSKLFHLIIFYFPLFFHHHWLWLRLNRPLYNY